MVEKSTNEATVPKTVDPPNNAARELLQLIVSHVFKKYCCTRKQAVSISRCTATKESN